MASKSIGSLYIDIEARTAKMEQDLERVKDTLRKTGSGLGDIGKAAGSAALQFVGLSAIARTVVAELKNIYANIDNIPGVPASVIESVHQMKYAFFEAHQEFEKAGAFILGKFAEIGQGIGFGLGRLVYGEEAAADGFKKMSDEAERFARIPFESKMAVLQEQLGSLSGTKGFHAESLRETATALEVLAGGRQLPDEVLAMHPEIKQKQDQFSLTGMSQQDSWNIQLEAAQKRLEAARIDQELRKTSADAQRRYNEVSPVSVGLGGATAGFEKVSAKLGLDKQLAAYQAQIKVFNEQLSQDSVDAYNGLASAQERVAKDYDNLTKAQLEVNRIMKQMKAPIDILRNTFINAFDGLGDYLTNWIMTGKLKFGDFVKTVIAQMVQMQIKLAVINPIMNAVFGGMSGYTSQPTVFAGHAAGGPVNAPSMVGELGPELFIPPAGGGTIIPNQQLKAGASGDAYHFVYNIKPGVTHAELVPILRAQEKRTMAAMEDARRRRKSL